MKQKYFEKLIDSHLIVRSRFLSLVFNGEVWKGYLPIVVIFCFALLIYIITLSPTINSFDSAELISGSYSLGIVHSPGYPMYLLLGRAVMFLFPENEAYAINFISAICGAVTLLFCYQACTEMGCSKTASTAAVLTLGSTYLFWSNAIITEVYNLDSLLLSIVLLYLVKFINAPVPGNLYPLAFFYGLGLSHHLSNILFAPWLGLIVLFHFFRSVKHILSAIWALIKSALLVTLPFLFYLYLPLRFISNTPINYVKQYFDVDLTTLPGIAWMISGRMFGPEMWQRSLPDTLSQILRLIGIMSINFLGIGIVIGIYGLVMMVRRKGSMALFIIGSVLLILFFFASYNVVDNDQMILPSFVVFSFAIGYGFTWLSRQVPGLKPYTLFYLALPITLLMVNGPTVNRNNDRATYEYASNIMTELPKDAFLVTQWASATPLEYMQIVEKRRPDIQIYDRGMAGLGLRNMFIREGMSKSLMDPIIVQGVTQTIMNQLPVRPVYITEADPVLGNFFCYKRFSDKLWWIYKPRITGEKCLMEQ